MSITLRNKDKIHLLVHEDSQWTINSIAVVVSLLSESVQAILTSELNMWHVSTKFVLHLLTTEQEEHRFEICQDQRQHVAEDPSFNV